jgi:hypothetical protein
MSECPDEEGHSIQDEEYYCATCLIQQRDTELAALKALNAELIAERDKDKAWGFEQQRQAQEARAIVAELLAALKEALDSVKAVHMMNRQDVEQLGLVIRIKALIARAEQKPPTVP